MFIFAIEQEICVMRSNELLKFRSIARRLSTSLFYKRWSILYMLSYKYETGL
jgi:hypothetical protein